MIFFIERWLRLVQNDFSQFYRHMILQETFQISTELWKHEESTAEFEQR